MTNEPRWPKERDESDTAELTCPKHQQQMRSYERSAIRFDQRKERCGAVRVGAAPLVLEVGAFGVDHALQLLAVEEDPASR